MGSKLTLMRTLYQVPSNDGSSFFFLKFLKFKKINILLLALGAIKKILRMPAHATTIFDSIFF